MNVRAYYQLTKPRVTYGNAITAVAGFLFAAQGHIDWVAFLALTIGMTFVIAAACVLNNYLDQDIDAKMERTKNREMVRGVIPGRNAVVFSVLLGLIGTVLLYLFTNLLTALIGIFGFVVYVWLYGAWSKRQSIHGTLVGSVSGAAPILGGYTAVANTIDMNAVLLFLILFLWQMPEFYSIAVYRRKEYKAAGVPVMTVVKGTKNTIQQIFAYTLLFVFSTLLLSIAGHASYTYLIVMALLGARWIMLAIQGLRAVDTDAWARKMFRFSLVILVVFSFIISIDAWLP
jgi:protoheme IX farnesyltransferase